jgi:hypothetical protein
VLHVHLVTLVHVGLHAGSTAAEAATYCRATASAVARGSSRPVIPSHRMGAITVRAALVVQPASGM